MNCLLWTEKKLQESGIFVKIFLKLMLNQHELMCNTPELNYCSTVWVKTDLAVKVSFTLKPSSTWFQINQWSIN